MRHHLGGEQVHIPSREIIREDTELEECNQDPEAGTLAHPFYAVQYSPGAPDQRGAGLDESIRGEFSAAQRLLLGYYTPDDTLIYAGRAGTGMPVAELDRLWQHLQPLVVDKMPLAIAPPRNSRFGSPLVLSRVHWVRPEMVVEVSYVEWTPDGLLRHVVYLGEREDKLATEVSRSPPHSGET